MHTPKLTLLVSALEASSNEHLQTLLELLFSKCNHKIHITGIFDNKTPPPPHITLHPIYHPKDFSVMGISSVIKKIFFILKVQKKMQEIANTCNIALFLDSSAFHIPLATKIKKNNPSIKILYYILPQVWASRPYRIKKIQEVFDELLAILPFELPHYSHSIPPSGSLKTSTSSIRTTNIDYVGHPLLDQIREFKSKPQGEGIVFMPGSRRKEIEKIWPIFCQIGKNHLRHKLKILVVPKIFKNQNLKSIYGENLNEFEVSLDARESLIHAEFAFICSGTATLEAALIGTPLVLAYKMNTLDFLILKQIVNLHYIGLANILLQALKEEPIGKGKSIMHEEYLQQNCTPYNLIQAYEKRDSDNFLIQSKQIRQYLREGSSKNVLTHILKHIG